MATRSPKADRPVSFGYKCAWYAVRTGDADAVAAALSLTGVGESNWAEGVGAAYADRVFVTPPLGDWVLAAGRALFYAGESPRSVRPLLIRLSDQFGEAQYFCTYRVPEAHAWGLARSGRLVRGFGYIGERGEVTWDEGRPTPAERALGAGVLEFPGPDEHHVMEVAAAWSVNPAELEATFTEPGLGHVGFVA